MNTCFFDYDISPLPDGLTQIYEACWTVCDGPGDEEDATSETQQTYVRGVCSSISRLIIAIGLTVMCVCSVLGKLTLGVAFFIGKLVIAVGLAAIHSLFSFWRIWWEC